MHLKQLKLAGFKSFVDPTVVYFPSQLVAVLGPNGCGKSNIIDAVRWVMGESSAKNLRGESMIDVIFNGSSNRKPVGQASVELIFDNSLGRLVGPFASYAELSVKRVVTRDGDSSYYLNGSRCRRRDITDIFLGTGAGARGYSIIGQGTISRLIEAKPEELRVFLEEAAGVSKYKERRKETLQRIGQTQENLNRVSDIRDELGKQLQRLERQAHAAERYSLLKEEEALCRAEILALKWQHFYEQQQIKQKELSEFVLSHEERQTILTQMQAQRTALNEQSFEANEQVQTIQKLFYQIGTEVARLEEGIQQQHREQKRLEQDKQQIQQDWQQAQEQIKSDEELVQQTQQKTIDLHEKVSLNRTNLEENERQFFAAQEQNKLWNEQWLEAQNVRNTIKNELQLVKVKKQHHEQRQQQTLGQLEQLELEENRLSLHFLEENQVDLEGKQENLKEQHLLIEDQLKQSTEQEAQLRLEIQDLDKQLQQRQKEFYQNNSELTALTAIQKAALQGVKKADEQHQWAQYPRLINALQVDEQWQFACERVLAEDLNAFIVDDLTSIWSSWEEYKPLGISMLTVEGRAPHSSVRPRLLDKIEGLCPKTLHRLDFIYAADNIEQLQCWLPELEAYESIITPEGIWVGAGWIKPLGANAQDEIGLLARQKKIEAVELIVAELQEKISYIEGIRETYVSRLEELNDLTHEIQSNFNQLNEFLKVNLLALEKNQHELNHTKHLINRFETQKTELNLNLNEINLELTGLQERQTSLELLVDEKELHYQQMQKEKETYQTQGAALQQTVEILRRQAHQAELEYDRELSKGQQLNERIEREQERLIILQERLEQVAFLSSQAMAPEQALQERLVKQILKHTEVENQLKQSSEHVLQIKIDLDSLDKTIHTIDLEMKKVQEFVAQVKMQEQELTVRAEAIQESLHELNLKAELVLQRIPPNVNQSMREDDLLHLNEKIKRLGAINLAAIEEFKSENQRKLYLDEQHADLIEALGILQQAIDKMDKETKLRLEATFNEVNTSFKALFPRLFGGGKAQLELTCDNLLEAGIVVMAQPPGKRNSTIHLLSGGEKAMTAVALVFAIFQLNPSPFCMLDEVDAPLDDVNVGRFCALVKEMSQFVQFLFITHNKVTMELADHLIGVTMREPGVSRLVTVDVKDALTME